MTPPGSIFSMAKARAVRFPQGTHCSPHHGIARTLCCAETFSLADLNHKWFKSSLFLHPFVPKCPDCNAIIYSLSRAGALRRIQWRMGQVSLHSAHPKDRTWAKRHHTLHMGWSVMENPLHFDQRNFSPPWDPHLEQIKPTDHKQKCTFNRENTS